MNAFDIGDFLYCYYFHENTYKNKLEITKSIWVVNAFENFNYPDTLIQMVAPVHSPVIKRIRCLELDDLCRFKIYSLTDTIENALKMYIIGMKRNIETVKKELKELQTTYNETQSSKTKDEIDILNALLKHYETFLDHAIQNNYEFIDCSIEDTLEQERE